MHTYSAAGNYTVNLTVTNEVGSDSEVKTDYIMLSESSTPEEPVAAFTANVTNGDVPLTVQFSDESTGSPTSWFWDFGDGANSTEQSPIHTYTSAETYTVNLTVENAAGSDFESKSDYIEVSEASGSTVTLYFDPESSSVAENESTEINLVASNFPAGLSGYNLTVALDDPDVAEIVDIDYPSWALITENSTLPGTSIYMKTVDLEDAVKADAADVVLATLTISGREKGSANLSIGVKRLEEDSGDSIEPGFLTGTIEVTILSPLPDQEYAPEDLDGDGLYEDLTGNGEFSFVDIVAYFHNMDWIEENMPVEYFDFNGNGRIDFDDVVRMFAMI
ncbi:cell surface protein [Methanosarcina siciliae HI350]|uniref:Cell surface protein n=1 Tax=Methanosarcina siciliae HI350 TaxID=1434119 RepID=A0A0E3PG91_9EURY|nr:cell surface protein [Methanosarcina siciliae HI350]